METVVLEI
jgi:hypothetical protein